MVIPHEDVERAHQEAVMLSNYLAHTQDTTENPQSRELLHVLMIHQINGQGKLAFTHCKR